ncbi:MAG: alpha/beta fold hydrolase [Bacteroidota bacterium]
MKSNILLIYLLCANGFLLAQADTSHFSYFEKEEYHAFIAESSTLPNGTTREKIVIDGFESRVPFYYIKPNSDKSSKYVILLHGITQSKNSWVYPMTSLAEKYIKLKDSLLTLGYTVIIPDAKYHGERSYEADFTSPLLLARNQDIQRSYNLFSNTVKDVRIIMDYIQMSQGNSAVGFNIIGYSMGGMMAIQLNAVDERLDRVVACVAPLDMKSGWMLLGAKEENAAKLGSISPKHCASLQKAPVTYLVSTKDTWYTQQEAKAFFDKIAVEDKIIKFYESGHFLPADFVDDAIEGVIKE